ncbi:hypothetical protein GCM10008957_06520 [Deinococcus ruber]|uniref:Uncharacterized protein n=1 Tax=Deinococcus ruber TaxID=1848197 RepID=A0A918BXI2_9DEIO|nr:hypothetical protein GCM10008957_06520 [Deinococcus ruber]
MQCTTGKGEGFSAEDAWLLRAAHTANFGADGWLFLALQGVNTRPLQIILSNLSRYTTYASPSVVRVMTSELRP